jgi:hypothetical protein
MTMASPLRGPKSAEGGGFAAAHFLARRAGYGAAPPAPRLLRIACGDGLRPALTPETAAAPGAMLDVNGRDHETWVQVLEDTWLVIRRRHPEIPAVVIILASGTESRQPRWGHFASGRWYVEHDERAEVMISGEALRLTPAEVLAVILHEAAHALACARGIKDTSRQGRYHNKQFKTHAEELGLTVEHDPRNGWSASKITGHAERLYTDRLTALAEAMTLWRRAETTGPATRRNTNLIAACCPCGRSIRVAASTLAEAPITCQACDGDFQAKTPADA